MGIWIRSQDKTTLAYCTRISMAGKTIQNLPATNIEDDYDILGKYESKERALEVMDEVENRICSPTKRIERYNNEDFESYFIYQMPQE